jgi:hypothetical protein
MNLNSYSTVPRRTTPCRPAPLPAQAQIRVHRRNAKSNRPRLGTPRALTGPNAATSSPARLPRQRRLLQAPQRKIQAPPRLHRHGPKQLQPLYQSRPVPRIPRHRPPPRRPRPRKPRAPTGPNAATSSPALRPRQRHLLQAPQRKIQPPPSQNAPLPGQTQQRIHRLSCRASATSAKLRNPKSKRPRPASIGTNRNSSSPSLNPAPSRASHAVARRRAAPPPSRAPLPGQTQKRVHRLSVRASATCCKLRNAKSNRPRPRTPPYRAKRSNEFTGSPFSG